MKIEKIVPAPSFVITIEDHEAKNFRHLIECWQYQGNCIEVIAVKKMASYICQVLDVLGCPK